MKTYTILLDTKHEGSCNGYATISEDGAKILWAAYVAIFGENNQTMERRQERGGICWLSEIQFFKDRGHLSKDFDYKSYVVEDSK
jgi:hypothetical protein